MCGSSQGHCALQFVAVCCSVSQCVVVCEVSCILWQCATVRCSVLQHVVVCCSVLQYDERLVARLKDIVCCSVVQRGAP